MTILVASQAIKKKCWLSSGNIEAGLYPGRGTTNLRGPSAPWSTKIKKNKKKAGVITNSLLTGSIIYEQREVVLEACSFLWYPDQTRAEMMRWRPSLRRYYHRFSCIGQMHCPLGVGRKKGPRGRCWVLERPIQLAFMTRIYMNRYNQRKYRSPYLWWRMFSPSIGHISVSVDTDG